MKANITMPIKTAKNSTNICVLSNSFFSNQITRFEFKNLEHTNLEHTNLEHNRLRRA